MIKLLRFCLVFILIVSIISTVGMVIYIVATDVEFSFNRLTPVWSVITSASALVSLPKEQTGDEDEVR